MTDKWKALERLRIRAAGGNHADEDCNIINRAFRDLEQRVEQFDKDWLLMMQEISLFDHETDWPNAGDDVLLEQFDPWAMLRALRKRVEGLEKRAANFY